MKNFSITKNGKEYWIARNVAVSCFVFTSIDGVWHVLANKRGDGTPDYQGYWNAPCGYLDFDETTSEAAMREVYEETGLHIQPQLRGILTFILPKWENEITFLYTSNNFEGILKECNEGQLQWIEKNKKKLQKSCRKIC